MSKKRNQMLITIDSIRHDVFTAANLPFLKKFPNAKAYTHGTYTLPAHVAFFTGKLPCNYNKGKFDNLARVNREVKEIQQWRLANPESDQPCAYRLQGKNIVDGFNNIGYNTIGTGAVSWFNTTKPAHIPVIQDFKKYKWFGEYMFAQPQINFVKGEIEKTSGNYFAFINFGETHHPFRTKPTDPEVRYGNPKCFDAQKRCLEYLDKHIGDFINGLSNIDVIICGDHGDCLGEDGLYGHSFHHPKVIEVPIIKISK